MAKTLWLLTINALLLMVLYCLIYESSNRFYPINIFVFYNKQSDTDNYEVDEAIDYEEKPEPTLEDFRLWTLEHEKKYESDEFHRKYETFLSNHYLVEKLNQQHKGQTEFRLNMFADMTPEEFKSKMLLKNLNKPRKQKLASEKYLPRIMFDELPDSFDWREKGAVTPIKDQGSVGTCWAFSAVENLEGVYQIKTQNLTSLSVEQIVDCDGFAENNSDHADCGVYGGWPYLVFEYVKSEGGIMSEQDYAYCAGKKSPCLPCSPPGYNKTECGPPVPYCKLKDSCQAKLDKSKFVPNLKVSDWKHTTQDEASIAADLMNYGPLSVALNAELLQFYFRGVFDPFVCPKTLNHAVLMVGWGVRQSKIFGNKPYWTVKNSWGSRWGESGYFRIARGKGACGINLECVTAILE